MADNQDKPRMNWAADNLPEAFQLFKQRCEIYFDIKNTAEAKQPAHILFFAGEEGLRRFNSWRLPAEDQKKPAKIWSQFEGEIVKPSENFRIARLRLQNMKQQESEPIDEYIAKLKLQAYKCDLNDGTDGKADEISERVIEQLTHGTRHPDLQKELLQKPKGFTLDAALALGRAHEASLAHMKDLTELQASNGNSAVAVHAMRSKKQCPRCGLQPHAKSEKCPAMGCICHTCGKPNHWATVCRAEKSTAGKSKQDEDNPKQPRRKKKQQKQTQKVDSVSELSDQQLGQFETVNFSVVNQKPISGDTMDTRDEVYATLGISLPNRPTVRATLKVKVDTGAQGNILPRRIYDQMFPSPGRPTLQNSSVVLTGYDGSTIQHYGCITLPCKYEGNATDARFFVAEAAGPAILGLPSSRNLRLVTVHCSVKTTGVSGATQTPIRTTEDLKKRYPQQFDRIGNFPGEYHIVLKDNPEPVIHAPRKCAINLKDELKDELDGMEQQAVIAKVSEPTDWVSSIVVARRANGKLRVCLDPKDLNKSIHRCHHRTPTVEEVTHKLAGSKYFSKLDARNSYWSVKLDTESSFLTTFNTPFGRYRYLRMPFGLVMSQDVFQHKMDQILEGLEGIVSIADDVIVHGRTEEEHDARMTKLMDVANDKGLMFNSEKTAVKAPQITFFGTVYDKEGAHPDPRKVEAIQQLKPPESKQQLHEFLGMATYLSPFIENLSAHTADLRELLKKDSDFSWSASHQRAFEKVKSLICTKTTLSYFDPAKETVIQVDASLKGIGAVLLQDGKPIAYASKSLSDAETRYANIERELLAVVFGCERFHTYVYGSKFQIDSDHKPLEMIIQKPLKSAPPRLQRMLLRLQPYDLTIRYRPGKEVPVPDALSRQPSPTESDHIELDTRVDFVQFSAEKLNLIQNETAKDATLSALKDMIVKSWPSKIRDLPKHLWPYWPFRDELSVEDGLILKGERVVIPTTVQDYILDKLHEGHQGVEKTKLRAKDTVYWVDIDKDIEARTKSCATCQEYRRSHQKETLIPHEIPTRPWQLLGTDLFFFDGDNYLIIADYYSKNFFIRKMPAHTTSQAVVNATRDIFSEQGIPEKIMSDNGRHFDSEVFRAFAVSWGFGHATSSPHFPQSNGFIERTIQTVKNTLKKAKASGKDPHMAMLCLRATPLDHNIPSPGEMLYNRKLRANLPVRVRNTVQLRDTIQEQLRRRQELQKLYHDQHAHDLPPLSVGQQVRIQDQSTHRWSLATVRESCEEPRSYVVSTPNGNLLRCNRRHIAAAPSPQKSVHPNDSVSADLPKTPVQRSKTAAGETITRSGRVVKPANRLSY